MHVHFHLPPLTLTLSRQGRGHYLAAAAAGRGTPCLLPAQAAVQAPLCLPPVSFLRKQESIPVSFLRKQESTRCHSGVSRNPGKKQKNTWIPTSAGMTYKGVFHRRPGSQQAFYRPNRRHRSQGRLYPQNRRRKSHKPKAPRASPASRPLAGSGTPSCNCKICSLGPP